ncbi:MAG: DNA-binding MarR family transcriptional regulator [Clostridium sp.]|jgi:DNA-binding MarR family transcriptional regulator
MQQSNDNGERIFHELIKVQRKFKELVSPIIREQGFTMTQILLMLMLIDHSDITLDELSKRAGISKSTVSVAIEQLVKRGVVARRVPEKNRRCINLSVNISALGILDELKKENGFLSKINKNLSNSEAEQLIICLKKLSL